MGDKGKGKVKGEGGTYKSGIVTGLVVGAVLGGFIGGTLMRSGKARGDSGGRVAVGQVSAMDLPVRRIGVPVSADKLQLVDVHFAASAEHRNVAWTEWGGNSSAKPVVIAWDKAGRWPVLDVPAGWCVVWLDGNKILGISDADGRQTNMVMAASPVKRAALLPGSLRPTEGRDFAYVP